jgi:hypothetical protein
MKITLTTLLLSALLLIGCADKPTSPIESNNHSYQLIKLPPKAGLSVENIFSKTKRIDGKRGGEIRLDESYVAADGHTVEIHAKLKVKRNSYRGHVDITLTIDDEIAAASFTPHMVFNKPLELDLKFEGIDLNEIESAIGEYDFIYINDTGIFEDVDHNGVIVQENNGTIRVNKAYLNHFSRYAFTR